MAKNEQKSGAGQKQDQWSDGVSKLMEAGRANMTAFNLFGVGLAALGAGAFAYMMDQTRRNAALEGAQKLADQMKEMWGLPGSQAGRYGSTDNGAGTHTAGDQPTPD